MLVMSKLIKQFLQHREVEENNSPCTITAYGCALRTFTKWVGDKRIHRLSLADVQKFRVHIKRIKQKNGDPLSMKTQKEYLVAIRSLLRYCNDQDIPAISLNKINLPKVGQPVVPFLTKKEVKAVIAVASKGHSVTDLRTLALIEVLYSTGCRISEILSLNRSQIDFERKEITVIGKGRKPRLVFLSNEACWALKRYFKKRTDNFKPLFIDHSTNNYTRNNGCRLKPRSAVRLVHKIGKKAGIEKEVTNHIFRHSFGTHMLDAGVDIRHVQEMLGHASLKTTQIYTHVSNTTLKRLHQKYHKKFHNK